MINASAAPQAKAIYWPCGYCKADGGHSCHTITGHFTQPHKDRHESVRLWLKYGQPSIELGRQLGLAESAAKTTAHIKALVAQAPPLTDERIDQLTVLLSGPKAGA